MRPRSRHPLAEKYLADLQRAGRRLPRAQRDELVAEISAHVDAATSAAPSEADIRTMLEDLGHPVDIVNAAAPSGTGTGPTGRLAVTLGVFAVLLIPMPGLGVPVGVVAAILGWRARLNARQLGHINRMATSAITLGAVAVTVPVLLFSLLASSDTDADTEDPPETTITGG